MSYQKGDSVRCIDAINCEQRLTAGKDYEVVSGSDRWVRVVCDQGHESGWHNSRFVPTPAIRQLNLNGPFVVGDVVDVVQPRSGGVSSEGSRITLGHADKWTAGEGNRYRLAIPVGGFKAGDLVEAISDSYGLKTGKRYLLRDDGFLQCPALTEENGGRRGLGGSRVGTALRIISRPDVNGWHNWTGGENPVPGMYVTAVKNSQGDEIVLNVPSEDVFWSGPLARSAFKVTDKASTAKAAVDVYRSVFCRSFFENFQRDYPPIIPESPFIFTTSTVITREPDKIDLADIQPGDEVTVRVTVHSKDAAGDLFPTIEDGTAGKNAFTADEILTHTPKLKVGDKVDCERDTGEIVMIEGDEAVVRDEYGIEIYSLEALQRAA